MGQRRSGGRRSGPRQLSPHGRLTVLVGTAALGAIGFSVLAPSAQAVDAADPRANRQAALILAEESAQQQAGDTDQTTSPQAASAVAKDQARAHALAAAAATSDAQAGPAPAPTFPATSDGYRAYAKSRIGAAQFSCLDPLWTRESGWRSTAHNPSSSAYGIAQLLDSTWSFTGVTKTSDGFRQVDAGLAYLREAYPAGPCSAWAHEKSQGWY